MTIEETTYYITKFYNDGALRVTLLDHNSGTVAVLKAGEGDQAWRLIKCSNGNYLIQTLNDGLYLAPEDLHEGAYLGLKEEAFEWRLKRSGLEIGRYHIIVPGGPLDGEKLAVDISVSHGRLAVKTLLITQTWDIIKKDD